MAFVNKGKRANVSAETVKVTDEENGQHINALVASCINGRDGLIEEAKGQNVDNVLTAGLKEVRLADILKPMGLKVTIRSRIVDGVAVRLHGIRNLVRDYVNAT